MMINNKNRIVYNGNREHVIVCINHECLVVWEVMAIKKHSKCVRVLRESILQLKQSILT